MAGRKICDSRTKSGKPNPSVDIGLICGLCLEKLVNLKEYTFYYNLFPGHRGALLDEYLKEYDEDEEEEEEEEEEEV